MPEYSERKERAEMLDMLKEVLSYLKKFNDDFGIVDKEEIEEQFENLEDFDKLIDEFKVLLDDFRMSGIGDENEMEDKLFELYLISTRFEWHFSEISDLSMSFVKKLMKHDHK